jgi:heme/copper-type cytochrome/quinol oxidase subunit 2
MTMRVLLALILNSLLLGIGVWDVVAITRSRPEDTVSGLLYSWSLMYPILPLVIGVLIGHVFWPHFPGQPAR